ncbi:MAG: RNA 2',3'-cyclic phosphodiesterase [Deltaproteobacteria bacterium]|nr:MAG: RNA 2',3'-cyclic phosphodiesterase [Deltaproteobacteria bacterium]
MADLRLFFALELGSAVRARAARIAAALREHAGSRDVRWVREESLHVTLRFLGSTDPARVADLAREIGTATRGIAPFSASLAGVELFPSPRRPRVVALGLEPRGALAALAAAVERGAVAAGFAPEDRPFRPHLTLGRTRDHRRFHLAADVTASVTAPGESWDVMETVLFRSDLAPSGARYTPLARVPLHP